MNEAATSGTPFLLAVLLGMFLLLLFLGLLVLIIRLTIRPPATAAPPLVPSEDGNYHVAGKRVSCHQCSGTSFKSQEILLNTWLLSLLRIDWLDSSATVLTCIECGRLTWFAQDDPSDQ